MIAVIFVNKRINLSAEIINIIIIKHDIVFTRQHYCFFVVCHAGTSTAQHDTTRLARHVVLVVS